MFLPYFYHFIFTKNLFSINCFYGLFILQPSRHLFLCCNCCRTNLTILHIRTHQIHSSDCQNSSYFWACRAQFSLSVAPSSLKQTLRGIGKSSSIHTDAPLPIMHFLLGQLQGEIRKRNSLLADWFSVGFSFLLGFCLLFSVFFLSFPCIVCLLQSFPSAATRPFPLLCHWSSLQSCQYKSGLWIHCLPALIRLWGSWAQKWGAFRAMHYPWETGILSSQPEQSWA